MSMRYIALTCTIALLAGCASSSLFNPYPKQANSYKQSIIENDYQDTFAELDINKQSADGLLYLQESGRLNQLAQNTPQSLSDFEAVHRIYQQIDDKALISASSAGATAISLISNENAIPYPGAAYERIMALQFQAFNYLQKNNIEAAGVEIRRAAFEQRQQEQTHTKQLKETEAEGRKQNLDHQSWENEPEFSGMNEFTSEIRNSFLNAYTFYSSAVFWESANNYNSALVDYKKALEIQPNNLQIKKDIIRTTKKQNHQYKTKENQGAIVILFEEGFVPEKHSISLTLPSFYYDTLFSIAVPYYERRDFKMPEALHIENNGKEVASTQILTHVSALAIKHLKEQMPALIIRQLLRARSKYELQRQAYNQSELGGFVTSIYNIISEQADRRSWLSLPNSLQAARLELPQGKQNLTLNSNGLRQEISVTVKNNKITLLRIVKAGNRYIINEYML